MLTTRQDIENEIDRAEDGCRNLYQAAIRLNADEVDNILKESRAQYPDQQSLWAFERPTYRVGQNYVRPCILQLIRDGKIESAKLLYERGARNSDDVYYLFKRSLSDDIIDEIAYYAIVCGFRDFCEFLRNDHWTRSPSIFYCILGAAERGDYEYLETLLAECPDGIGQAICGVASSGDVVKTEELLSRDDFKRIYMALWGAANGGHQAYVLALLKREAVSADAIFLAALDAMKSGHVKLAKILLGKSRFVMTSIFSPFITEAAKTADANRQYVEELQIKVLLNPALKLDSKDSVLQYIKKCNDEEKYNRLVPREHAVIRTVNILRIKSTFPGMTDDQWIAITDPENVGAWVLLLQMSIFSGFRKNGASQFSQIGYVALLKIFSAIFGAEPGVIYNQNATSNGLGGFLFSQRKIIGARSDESEQSQCCIQ